MKRYILPRVDKKDEGGSHEQRRQLATEENRQPRSPLEENKWKATHDDSSTIQRRETAGSQGIIYYYEVKALHSLVDNGIALCLL